VGRKDFSLKNLPKRALLEVQTGKDCMFLM
jgi:hypothetical protein